MVGRPLCFQKRLDKIRNHMGLHGGGIAGVGSSGAGGATDDVHKARQNEKDTNAE